jgi:hypothetical protein
MTVRLAGASTAPETARLEDAMSRLARDAFSGDALTGIIETHNLYRRERAESSTEDVMNRMRSDVGVQLMFRSVAQGGSRVGPMGPRAV